VEFRPLSAASSQVENQMNKIESDAKQLKQSFQSIDKKTLQHSNNQLNSLLLKYEKVSRLIQTLKRLCVINDHFQADVNAIAGKMLVDATRNFNKIVNLIESLPEEPFVGTQIFKAIKEELTIRKETLLYELDEYWQEVVMWTKDDGNKVLQLSLVKEDSDLAAEDFIWCLSSVKTLDLKMQSFGDICLEVFFEPLITNPSKYEVSIEEVDSKFVCRLLHIPGVEEQVDGNNWESKLESVRVAFDKFLQVLMFLHKNFLSIQTNEDETLMKNFSKNTCSKVMKMFVDDCLEATVPESIDELSKYDKVENLIKSFEGSLNQLSFLNSEQESLMSYVTTIHGQFTNRRKISILKKARVILKKDLLITMENEDKVCHEIDSCLTSSLLDFIKSDTSVTDTVSEVVTLPKFKISSNINEFVIFIEEIFKEAKQLESECATKFYSTINDVLDLFISLAPLEEKKLKNISQAAALFHNNCWYICCQLNHLTNKYSCDHQQVKKEYNITYENKITKIRQLSMKWFFSQIKSQRDALDECMEPLRLVVNNPDQEKYPAAEKCIKQVLLQIHHLKKVWINVLPPQALKTSLVILVNSALGLFINIICSIEDVTSNASDQLSLACALLKDKVPYLFMIPGQTKTEDIRWQRHMNNWHKLNDLHFLLVSSLKEIVSRWSDGKGPLAETFSMMEVKNMIRALFQNTEYRAEALCKIRVLNE